MLAALLSLGTAELVAALLGRTSSPVIAVGGAFVDRTPRWLKEFAIRTFGENDKDVLIAGVVATVLVLALLVGALAVRRRVLGYAFIALLAAVAASAAVSRPNADWQDVLPSLVGGLLGGLALGLLLHAVSSRVAPRATTTEAGSQKPESQVGVGRRRFLVAAAGVGVAAVSTELIARAARSRLDVAASRAAVRLPVPASPAPALAPGAMLRTAGLSSFYTASRDFYRVDTALTVPQLTTEDWRLRIHGDVERELSLDWQQLLARPMIERDITLTCVSNEVGGNLVGTARWLGVPLKPLLEEAGPRARADQIVSRSVDGMTIGTPTAVVMDGRDAMLAVAMNGEPLLPKHGFPVRMVVPGLYGYVSATKWVTELELTSFDAYDAYWVKRGWAEQAPIKTASRIDTPRPFSKNPPGRVAVAGVAWAQHRGVSKVEVRVDGGPWQPAQLSAAGSKDLWRQWVWEWDATEPGTHKLEVRATDADGETQPQTREAPFPEGSQGWHSVVVRVTD
ncbi:molybdopterin-dependent oxidoreductase [Motilibacter sp. E257]|uniref:Molybdopterin-dependent oxidoreductase n=1 Tax=Motilibacter deserti TaxID=2714956 RepID=A0ABX0GY16_9ACTN|nr:molybdopterin-dependent oxidoreductase [Motilibacter deserti]